MKRVVKYGIILLIIVLVIVGLWFLFHDKEGSGEEILDGASMVIKEGTLSRSGASILITDYSESDEVHTYGDWFRIDEYVDGKWVELEPIIDDYGFNAIGYTVDENHELEMDVNWEWLYGELEDGTYRLVKDVAVSSMQSKYVYAEFVLSK